MITVHFRTGSDETTSRVFPKGAGVSIYGKATGASGLGSPGTAVRLEIPEKQFLSETSTNAWGDFAFWYVLPNEDCRLTVKLTAAFSVAGIDRSVVPIAVGSAVPDVLPPVEGYTGAGDTLKTLLYVGVGLVVLLVILKAQKVI